ncbi:hypothetical protein SAMN04244559_00460 [Magnetospirillum fulvum]|uniref:Uncharacterized protein n=1 Tax=Magnetospirillum fulvum TaxID=1082 RepID=A0A1H6GUJ7_MAGFU|nr:hypothetical protein SAMN04244559_00460 [Magnetospirillum fulvum]
MINNDITPVPTNVANRRIRGTPWLGVVHPQLSNRFIHRVRGYFRWRVEKTQSIKGLSVFHDAARSPAGRSATVGSSEPLSCAHRVCRPERVPTDGSRGKISGRVPIRSGWTRANALENGNFGFVPRNRAGRTTLESSSLPPASPHLSNKVIHRVRGYPEAAGGDCPCPTPVGPIRTTRIASSAAAAVRATLSPRWAAPRELCTGGVQRRSGHRIDAFPRKIERGRIAKKITY